MYALFHLGHVFFIIFSTKFYALNANRLLTNQKINSHKYKQTCRTVEGTVTYFCQSDIINDMRGPIIFGYNLHAFYVNGISHINIPI